jgi:hypothetical protein
MNDASNPVFYDCEASELDEGYIIEIGWAFSDGEGFIANGSLIRPLAAWNIDDAWSSEAESLHGISLARLREEGRPAEDVARMMNEALAGRELFSDDPAYDIRWLGQLFDAAGVQQNFVVSETPARPFLELLATKHNFDSTQFQSIWEDSRREHRDRAEADALSNARLWRTIMQGPTP